MLQLTDGRALEYREYGDPAGRPVINCHGGLLCGLDVAPFDDAARDAGIRLVSPDRPGLNGSDPLADRTTANWADDVRELADALGLERFGVLGWSMGGQYALACATQLADRVDRTVVIAGALPLDDDATFGELNAMDQRLTKLSVHHPHVAQDVFEAMGEIARHRPKAWAHLTARGAVTDEATALADLPHPGITEAAAAAMHHGTGMVGEYQAWVRPWGFALEAIAGSVVIWQGSDDDLIPAAWGATLADRIPGARLHAVAGAGHFVGYSHTAEVLGEFA